MKKCLKRQVEFLRVLRYEKNCSQLEFSLLMDLSQPTYSRMERGMVSLRLEHLMELCESGEFDPASLFVNFFSKLLGVDETKLANELLNYLNMNEKQKKASEDQRNNCR